MSLQKPLLPSAERLLPYLKRIDSARWYTNSGPLLQEYEARLSTMFNTNIVATSSATSALTATLMAFGLPAGSMVAVPSWTYVASPASIVAAGLVPYFYDIYIDPASLPVSAIMLVAPFGAPVEIPDTDIPILIDAAAGFDSYHTRMGDIPTIISTHATKVFSTGEGGFVGCTDAALLDRVRLTINNGFSVGRDAPMFGINGKMSEYHAAVGLAELDGWEEKRAKWLALDDSIPYATSTKQVMDGSGIKKQIYGCHKYTTYKNFPRTKMEKTEYLMKTMTFKSKWIEP